MNIRKYWKNRKAGKKGVCQIHNLTFLCPFDEEEGVLTLSITSLEIGGTTIGQRVFEIGEKSCRKNKGFSPLLRHFSMVKKMTRETAEVCSDKRKPRMLLRHRTS